MARFRPGSPQPVVDLLDAIQHVAEAATGERSFLHVAGVGGIRPFAANDRES